MYACRVLTAAAPVCLKFQNYQKIVDDPIEGLHLKLQLAVLCYVGRVITKATYVLEGDAPLMEKVQI